MKVKRLGEAALTFILCCVILVFILFSDDARQGAKDGIGICEGIIIPSLLPILIICKFITGSRLSRCFEPLFGRGFEFLFRIPKEAAGAVILGLISGYPSGAVLTCSLYENGVIDESAAERIMKFNVCGGAAFIITAVGTVTLGSTKEGAVLFICNVASALTVAFLTRFNKSVKSSSKALYREYPGLTDSFCSAVEETVKALAVMCAYIVLFSVISKIICPPAYLIPLLEITNGVCKESALPSAYTAFFLSFSGLCVHFQLLPYLNKMKISYFSFLTGRMSCAVIAFIYYRIYAAIFPESSAVFSNISSPAHSFSSGNLALSMIMIIGCAVLIFDIENRKIKLHS